MGTLPQSFREREGKDGQNPGLPSQSHRRSGLEGTSGNLSSNPQFVDGETQAPTERGPMAGLGRMQEEHTCLLRPPHEHGRYRCPGLPSLAHRAAGRLPSGALPSPCWGLSAADPASSVGEPGRGVGREQLDSRVILFLDFLREPP